jgi:hypothetical protein
VNPVRIAVVGVGPRGLSVLERVISHTRREGSPPAELLLIDPGELGTGVHRGRQPDYLLLNTIASQLTIFSDGRMTPGGPVTEGPSFFEWCLERYDSVRFDDYLPRRLLSEYLRWAVGELLRRVPRRLVVRHLPVAAVDVRPNGAGAAVTLADGTRHAVDLAIVTTGHGIAGQGRDHGDDRLITAPYPLPERVDGIPPGSTVALLGTGLTAMDIVAALTLGRGGEFTACTYRASGREPRIILANRTGWLPCARPGTMSTRRAAPARYFTPAAVARAREATPDGRLDFRRDVGPLIRREALWRLGTAGAGQVEAVFRVLDPPQENLPCYEHYSKRLVELAAADLREAEAGLGFSPVKESLEILRDHRESLRAALDPPGLTEDSHRFFTAEYAPLINRAVVGPQKERIRELLALISAQIVLPGPGPSPELARCGSGWTLRSTHLARPCRMAADVAVAAHLRWPVTDPLVDPIAGSLRGWTAPGPDGALRLDRDGYLVARSCAEPVAVAVFGPPAEGASYYNHYVPSPAVWSRALTDLDRVLGPVLMKAPPEVEVAASQPRASREVSAA